MKMYCFIKKVLLYSVIISSMILNACNSTSNSNQTSTETKDAELKTHEKVYNDKIQNVFFDVPLGASKEEVVEGFAKHGFYENSYSTDSRLSFEKKTSKHALPSEFFSFGGMNWKFLNVYLSNNHFQSIEFTNPFKSKKSALEHYEDVLSPVSLKYNLYEKPSSDTSLYKRYCGETKDKQWIIVTCYSYESVTYDRWYGVSLVYGDDKYTNISDEL